MKIGDLLYIENILQSILIVEEYTKNISFKEFKESQMRIDAVSKRLEEIGENAKKVSGNLKRKYGKVEWKNLREMRNFLVHVYGYVKAKRIYNEAIKKIPILKEHIKKIKEELKNE